MIKLIVMYGQPDDPAAFDAHYLSVHTGLVAQLPGLRRFEVAKCASTDGTAAPYYLQAELWFDDAASMDASFATPEGQATRQDVTNFATGDVTRMVGEVVSELVAGS